MSVKPVTILGKKCLGLHVGADAGAIDGADVTFLSACKNIIITTGYKIQRRMGYTSKVALAVTSFHGSGLDSLFTTEDALYRLNSDYTYTILRNGMNNQEMFYTDGPDGIYYNNGIERGLVRYGSASEVWKKGTYYGPPTTKQFSGPPVGKFILWYLGRMYVADGKVLWYSEYMSTNLFDQEKGLFMLDSECIGVVGVGAVLYVFTRKQVYTFTGGVMIEKSEAVVSRIPPIKGTMQLLSGPGAFAEYVVWATEEGLFVGASDGSIKNITEDRIKLPDISDGCGFSYNGKYYLTLNRR